MTDIQTIIIPLVLVAAIVFAAFMFAYRKISAGEAFDANKMLQTMGIAALAGITLYIATGTIPSLDAILTQMASYAPNDLTLTGLGAVVFGIFQQYILKGKAGTTPIISEPSPSAAAAAAPSALEVAVDTSGRVQVGDFKVFVPWKDVGLDPAKYPTGSLDWQHACSNVIAAEAGYSDLSSATGKPTAANPLERQAIQAAAMLAAFQGVADTRGGRNIKEDAAAVGANV